MKAKSFGLIICFMWAIPMILFSTLNIRSRALIEVSGTILKSEEGHVFAHPHRLHTTYTIQPFDGGKTIRYTAHSVDPSLALHLPVDTVVEKKKWQLSYFINGEKVSDFPIRFYAGIGLVGILLFLIGLIVATRELWVLGASPARIWVCSIGEG